MAATQELISHLDELLEPARFSDYGPNGLQVRGTTDVSRVVTGVSANRELIERAVSLGAHLILVHHGLFWRGDGPGLSPQQTERLRPLFVHDVNLAAYHLPLDGHPEYGNNALLATALGAEATAPFAEHGGVAIGRIATFPSPGLTPTQLGDRVARAVGREPLIFEAGPPSIRSLGIVTGGAAKGVSEAIDRGLDAYLTGEPWEGSAADAREGGIHFIAAGHHATETFGVRALGDLLEQRFGVEHVFVDVPNPV